ncbi:MAG: GntR family transcriptional regulator [Nakamurella sp.]
MTSSAARRKTGSAVGVSKSEQAHAWIKERISGRDFTPGYRLVLTTIADKLEMSIIPVREAIRRLEAEGLVTYERNVGARVAMIDDSHYRYSMQTLAILEGSATALSARFITADRIDTARTLNEQMKTQLDAFDPEGFTALNQRFHHELFSSCPNPRLLELVDTEWARLGRLRASTFAFVPGRSRESVHEHEAMLRLIEDQAPLADIEHAARAHRNATLEAYLVRQHPGDVDAFPII